MVVTFQVDANGRVTDTQFESAYPTRLGYAPAQSIRLYGEKFEVISDPFPEAGGIAVSVRAKKGDAIRTVQPPATVLQSVKGLPNAGLSGSATGGRPVEMA